MLYLREKESRGSSLLRCVWYCLPLNEGTWRNSELIFLPQCSRNCEEQSRSDGSANEMPCVAAVSRGRSSSDPSFLRSSP
ncbi:Hypothetical predicted protein [Cloeon dipterum]|uniref:Uncharacterized protein n=1 Tax=Cloeon dipterum TaxID=197152 RepID=A0A8S1BUJ3_9INSE|nr:Hypothetical predicted protein [Cloeon dipterum]